MRMHLFTFLVEIPEDGEWDADDVRAQIGGGIADMYADEPVDMTGWGAEEADA